ncbi:hypothetical protein VTL71DRAFT_12390 [Oculimacula yallundae]|uniref:Uncharacterized protein n=1 Tax=Oculimacula yallundae TaxID=86028 RepID=A0ABR4CMY1_9HELO
MQFRLASCATMQLLSVEGSTIEPEGQIAGFISDDDKVTVEANTLSFEVHKPEARSTIARPNSKDLHGEIGEPLAVQYSTERFGLDEQLIWPGLECGVIRILLLHLDLDLQLSVGVHVDLESISDREVSFPSEQVERRTA